MSREGIQPQLQERGIALEELVYSNTSVSVYRSTYKGVPAATKVQQVQDPGNALINREFEAMMSLQHEHLLRMYDYFFVGVYYVIVTEWCNKDVKKDIDQRKANQYPYTEADLWSFLQSTASALAYMQQSHMAHRDIKPANLFIDKNRQYLIGDFGSSRAQEVVLTAQTIAGTPLYMSPELRLAMGLGSRNAPCDPYKSDMYSLGLTLLEMALLRYPKEFGYMNSTDQERMMLINTLQLSENLKAALRWMLAPSEEARCNFIELQNWMISLQSQLQTQMPVKVVPVAAVISYPPPGFQPAAVPSQPVAPAVIPFQPVAPAIPPSQAISPAPVSTDAHPHRSSPTPPPTAANIALKSPAERPKQGCCCLLW